VTVSVSLGTITKSPSKNLPEETERVSTSDDSTIKIPKPSLSDYKLPFAPKREFLAIPNGWRHNCKVVTKRHYIGSDASYNDDHKRAKEKNST